MTSENVDLDFFRNIVKSRQEILAVFKWKKFHKPTPRFAEYGWTRLYNANISEDISRFYFINASADFARDSANHINL